MHLIPIIAGFGIAAAGLLDVFATVLRYNRFGLLSKHLYAGVWATSRWLSIRVGMPGAGVAALNLAGPLMIVLSIALWITLEIVGFALIYLPGMSGAAFVLDPPRAGTFMDAVYLSGVSLATLASA